MEQSSIQRLRDNVRVFEQMAEGLELRIANMTDRESRARVVDRLAEVHQHIGQLKARLLAAEGHRGSPHWSQRSGPTERTNGGFHHVESGPRQSSGAGAR
jgi:hypothetical protein